MGDPEMARAWSSNLPGQAAVDPARSGSDTPCGFQGLLCHFETILGRSRSFAETRKSCPPRRWETESPFSVWTGLSLWFWPGHFQTFWFWTGSGFVKLAFNISIFAKACPVWTILSWSRRMIIRRLVGLVGHALDASRAVDETLSGGI